MCREDSKTLLAEEHQLSQQPKQEKLPATKTAEVTSNVQATKTAEKVITSPKLASNQTENTIKVASETINTDKEKILIEETKGEKASVHQTKESTQQDTIKEFISATKTEIIEKRLNSIENVQETEGVEKSAALLTGVKQVENFHVAVEVNVDVDDMSRRYSGLSSSRG